MVTAETITEKEIREVWSSHPNAITGRTLMVALREPNPSGELPSDDDVRAARARCAEVMNRREQP